MVTDHTEDRNKINFQYERKKKMKRRERRVTQ
jgi:hypothetical protein